MFKRAILTGMMVLTLATPGVFGCKKKSSHSAPPPSVEIQRDFSKGKAIVGYHVSAPSHERLAAYFNDEAHAEPMVFNSSNAQFERRIDRPMNRLEIVASKGDSTENVEDMFEVSSHEEAYNLIKSHLDDGARKGEFFVYTNVSEKDKVIFPVQHLDHPTPHDIPVDFVVLKLDGMKSLINYVEFEGIDIKQEYVNEGWVEEAGIDRLWIYRLPREEIDKKMMTFREKGYR